MKAETEFLRIETVSEGAYDWTLPKVEICIPTDAPSASSVPVRFCDRDLFEGRVFESYETLRWTDDYILEIHGYEPGLIEIYVSRIKGDQPVFLGDLEIMDGSLLFIPLNSPERVILPIRGQVTIGEPPLHSDAQILRSGRFEIRQKFGRKARHVVAEGALFTGDRISFSDIDPPLWHRLFTAQPEDTRLIARLFLTGLSGTSPGFEVIATTDAAYSTLDLTRIGAEPAPIPVTWTQRFGSDPLPVGLASVLGLLATIIALSNNFFANRPPAGQKTRQNHSPDELE